MFPFYDPTFILLIPAILIAGYAQLKVSSTYAKYSKVNSSSNITGARLARNLLDSNGLGNIAINQIPGEMTDNYNPQDKSLYLSDGVYGSSSVAALGIVAHEVGHAIQDAKAYAPLAIRGSLVPMTNFGTTLAFPFVLGGLFMNIGILMDIGIILYSFAVFFTLVTLPVEFNASNRAMSILTNSGYVTNEEASDAKKVLNAAAMTYVAAALTAALELIRLLIIRNSRND